MSEDEEFADEEGLNDEEDAPKVESDTKPQKVAPEQAKEVSDEEKKQAELQEQVMLLQNNGIFRAELLHQLNEIKRALTILASIGIELTKEDDSK